MITRKKVLLFSLLTVIILIIVYIIAGKTVEIAIYEHQLLKRITITEEERLPVELVIPVVEEYADSDTVIFNDNLVEIITQEELNRRESEASNRLMEAFLKTPASKLDINLSWSIVRYNESVRFYLTIKDTSIKVPFYTETFVMNKCNPNYTYLINGKVTKNLKIQNRRVECHVVNFNNEIIITGEKINNTYKEAVYSDYITYMQAREKTFFLFRGLISFNAINSYA